MSAQTDLDAAASVVKAMVDIMVAVTKGAADQTVNNGTVDLPTLAKFFADAQIRVDAAIDAIAAEAVVGRKARTIVPSDTALLDPPLNGGLWFPNGGHVTMEYENGFTEDYTFAPLTDWPRNPVRIMATGTDPGIQITGYSGS